MHRFWILASTALLAACTSQHTMPAQPVLPISEAAPAPVTSAPVTPAPVTLSSAPSPNLPAPAITTRQAAKASLKKPATARQQPPSSPKDSAEDDVTLSFDNADIKTVANIILGDMLGETVVIDSDVTGTLSLTSNGAVPKSSLKPALATALAGSGAVLLQQDGINRISLNKNRNAAPLGDGVTILRPKAIDSTELARLLTGILGEGAVTSSDSKTASQLYVNGDARLRALAEETATLFDTDALKDTGFVLRRLNYGTAETLAAELTATLQDAGDAIRIIPLRQLNAILILSRQQSYLDTAETWLDRLDTARDGTARHLYVYRLTHRKAAEIATALNSLITDNRQDLKDIKIIADSAPNNLLISASEQQYAILSPFLGEMDATPQQILIEATLVEVNLNDRLRYGVQYALDTGSLLDKPDSQFVFTARGQNTPLTPELPGFSFALGTAGRPEALIEALSAQTSLRVVSSPKLLVLNNQPARLSVGDSVPIVTQTTTATQTANPLIVNAVQYRDTGVNLTVTPHAGKGQDITLEVEQEVSDVAETTSSSIDSPTIQQRKLTTTVTIPNGKTVLLAGLIRDSRDSGGRGIPLLQDLPALGGLFRRSDRGGERTELLAMLTPHIIATPTAAVDETARIRQDFTAILEAYRDSLPETVSPHNAR